MGAIEVNLVRQTKLTPDGLAMLADLASAATDGDAEASWWLANSLTKNGVDVTIRILNRVGEGVRAVGTMAVGFLGYRA